LQAGAQEGVGRTAHAKPTSAGAIEEITSIVEINGKRFFVVDRLARADCGEANLAMGGWNREVYDEIDRGTGKQIVNGARIWDLEFGGFCPRPFENDVGAGDNVESLKLPQIGEIDSADVAASDNTDADAIVYHPSPRSLNSLF
jgi:hypothetical protein